MLIRLTCLMLLTSSFGCGSADSTSDVDTPSDTNSKSDAESTSGTDAAGSLSKVFGSSVAIDTIKSADSVKAYRLPSPSEYRASLSGYKMSAGPIDVPDDQIAKLHAVLLDKSTYGWDYAKGCIPDYGVRIQFQHDSHEVDVLLCFECDILSVYHNGKAVGGEDFDDGRPQLVKIVKTVFPDDQVIQSLKEES